MFKKFLLLKGIDQLCRNLCWDFKIILLRTDGQKHKNLNVIFLQKHNWDEPLAILLHRAFVSSLIRCHVHLDL